MNPAIAGDILQAHANRCFSTGFAPATERPAPLPVDEHGRLRELRPVAAHQGGGYRAGVHRRLSYGTVLDVREVSKRQVAGVVQYLFLVSSPASVVRYFFGAASGLVCSSVRVARSEYCTVLRLTRPPMSPPMMCARRRARLCELSRQTAARAPLPNSRLSGCNADGPRAYKGWALGLGAVAWARGAFCVLGAALRPARARKPSFYLGALR